MCICFVLGKTYQCSVDHEGDETLGSGATEQWVGTCLARTRPDFGFG